ALPLAAAHICIVDGCGLVEVEVARAMELVAGGGMDEGRFVEAVARLHEVGEAGAE
ncbi:MAG: hypothetical protein GY731_03515, partial [Gammaproteobacteria bacterium]|nr:hypothetical protein [Gammaproteobacteria bacterium]